MKEPIPTPKDFGRVVACLVHTVDCKTATIFLSPKLIVRATWRHKPSLRNLREEMVVTYGAPNYLEQAFIVTAKKAGEPFPIKKVQLRPWPKVRKARGA